MKNKLITRRWMYKLSCFCVSASLMLTMYSCEEMLEKEEGQEEDKQECYIPGVVSLPRYIFYIRTNYGSDITVTLQDKNGKKESTGTHSILSKVDVVSDPLPDMCGMNTFHWGLRAHYALTPGTNYTYTAINASGKSWTGEIAVPCQSGGCYAIELK